MRLFIKTKTSYDVDRTPLKPSDIEYILECSMYDNSMHLMYDNSMHLRNREYKHPQHLPWWLCGVVKP